ncbi:conserved hypothetical protein [Theileria equi strain WA]|uniref:F-box domain-containing protein n=1 Tax=Theileria equi strain WA TaxID=1537102 RepID=L1LEW1_THEEQ|nr:conserved hypothetical protein [Theileria equi strain WA]EKX73809.1 conserved hypothetical protein [Theileria equi strain WA]|eukprot:XP_004833261.1 conserved hypothetical protein [Theileria equi strain WA]
MENELSRFIRQAPSEVIELVCGFLDFSDFLALTSISRLIRSALVSYHRCWLNFYSKGHVHRHYEIPISIDPLQRRDGGVKGSETALKYALRMPSFDRQIISNPAAKLLSSARKVEIIKMNNAHSSNPLLDLGILDRLKRDKWKGEPKQDVKVLSSFPNPILVAPVDKNKPFSVMSNSHMCSFKEGGFMVNSFLPSLKNVKVVCWVRLQDGKMALGHGIHASFNCRSDSCDQKVLAVIHENGRGGVAISFYQYEESHACGLASSPGFTIDVDIESGDKITSAHISGLLLTWSNKRLQFTHLNIILGSHRGKIYWKRSEKGSSIASGKYEACQFPISEIEVLFGSMAILYSKAKYLGVVRMVDNGWETLESVQDSITSFSVDMDNCILGYCTSIHNRSTFLDLCPNMPCATIQHASYSVPKPPLCITYLNRDSKWALVIRNYIRVLQVVFRDTLVFKSLFTLNGHTQPITQCVHDGWSKLVSVDSTHQIFVWDYMDGCKLFSFSLVSSTRERGMDPLDVYIKAMNGGQRNGTCKNDRHRGKMGNLAKYIKCKIGRDEWDDSPLETDSDYTPTHSTIDSVSSQSARYAHYAVHKERGMRGLLEPSKREDYHVNVSVQSLLIYYQGSKTMQVWSFK